MSNVIDGRIKFRKDDYHRMGALLLEMLIESHGFFSDRTVLIPEGARDELPMLKLCRIGDIVNLRIYLDPNYKRLDKTYDYALVFEFEDGTEMWSSYRTIDFQGLSILRVMEGLMTSARQAVEVEAKASR